MSPVEVVRAISMASKWDGPNLEVLVRHFARPNGALSGLLNSIPDVSTKSAASSQDQLFQFPDAASAYDPAALFSATHDGAGFVGMTLAEPFPTVPLNSGGRGSWPLAVAGFGRNVSFLYDGARQIEALLVAPDPEALDTDGGRWSQRLKDMCGAVAAAAVEVNAPILFMFGPSAPPADFPSRETARLQHHLSFPEEWRDHQAPALRFSVALSRADPKAAAIFRKHLIDATLRLNCSLLFRRAEGDRAGVGWEPIVDLGPISTNRIVTPVIPPKTHLLSLTVVGPARVGSTHDLLRLIDASQFGLSSIAVTALDGLAIIHMSLRTPRSQEFDQLELYENEQNFVSFKEFLDKIASNHAAADLGSLEAQDFSRLDKYQFCITTNHGPRNRPVEGIRKPIWLAWRTPRVPGAINAAVCAMEDAIRGEAQSIDQLDVDFLICRESREDWLRGRCKLSLPHGDFGMQEVRESRDEERVARTKREIGAWCSRVERAWRDNLVKRLHSPWVETEVAWRERWIGRLDTFISIR